MRIVWLSHRSTIGGAELSLAEGVRALAQRGHEVHVVLPVEGPLRHRLAAAASITVCHHNPWVTHQRGLLLAVRWLAYDALVAAPRIARLIRRVDADVVISGTITVVAGGLAVRRRLPHVWFLQEFGARDHGLRFLLGERLTHWLMARLGDTFIVASEALRTHYAQRLRDRDVRRVRYAVNVPDADESAPQPSGSSRSAGPLRAVLLGRRTPSKGQHEALEALSLLAAKGLDIELCLVGNGDPGYDEELRSFTTSQGLDSRVRFVSFSDDPRPYVAEADVGLMCSRAEAFGRVTIEFMKLGKPVVGTASGATPELIRHGWNGLLYSPGDPGELARCLEELYHDRPAAREMGLRAREWAQEQFNLGAYGADLDAVLHATVSRAGTRGS